LRFGEGEMGRAYSDRGRVPACVCWGAPISGKVSWLCGNLIGGMEAYFEELVYVHCGGVMWWLMVDMRLRSLSAVVGG
jgi:hypothetical protein